MPTTTLIDHTFCGQVTLTLTLMHANIRSFAFNVCRSAKATQTNWTGKSIFVLFTFYAKIGSNKMFDS